MTDSLPMPVTALSSAQRTAILNLVRRAARAEILPRFRSLSEADIAQKTGPQDLVTEADTAAEAMIARGLSRMFPGALIVGEEAASKDPDLIGRIAEAETAFVIDPVDGTWNFARGLTTFGVMVGMLRFGQPVFGLLYDPVMDDVIWGGADLAAEMVRPRRAPRPLRASPGGPVDQLLGYVPLFNFEKDLQPAVAAVLPRFGRAWSLRCSCHESRMFAQGNVDFVLSARLTPWDHAPGAAIALEAGGHVAMLDGSPYKAHQQDGYLLMASDAATWGRVRDVFSFLI